MNLIVTRFTPLMILLMPSMGQADAIREIANEPFRVVISTPTPRCSIHRHPKKKARCFRRCGLGGTIGGGSSGSSSDSGDSLRSFSNETNEYSIVNGISSISSNSSIDRLSLIPPNIPNSVPAPIIGSGLSGLFTALIGMLMLSHIRRMRKSNERHN